MKVCTGFWTAGLIAVLVGCQVQDIPAEKRVYENEPLAKTVTAVIEEASGIADSKVNPGHLWVHEDGGNTTQLHLLRHTGEVVGSVSIKGVVNRDWEDMVLAGDQLYLADIGDNNLAYTSYTIYKFQEPRSTVDTIRSVESIKFAYPDGPHDAEALLVDPARNEIYIITKRDKPSRIYKIGDPQAGNTLNKAELVGTLPYSGVVSATLSADGKGVIVKTYTGLFLYSRSGNEPLDKALQKNYNSLPYQMEPQGEAVTFSARTNGYFTLSEKGAAKELTLYFYKMN